MLKDYEFQDLCGIVGERWVNTEPAMADTYSFYMNPEILVRDGGRFAPRPEAVVLPGSVEEVRGIVKYCNQSDLMAKPLSTGFGTWAAASRSRVIVLDLRRMDRILELDAKNGVAVIEPYVRAIDLQTRAMEQGWNVHVVSCGGNHSVLASTCAAWGYGVTGSSMSFSGRNLLGAQWVLPTGEILELGSAGNNCGWFSADGPGPSLRGVMRGFSGTFGALGVFTRCAVKLYKWDGPARWEVEGKSPAYTIKEIPPRMSMNALSFPNEQAMRDAGYLLGEAGIEFAQFRTPMFFSALGMTENNQDLKAFLDSGLFQKIANWILVNAVVGYSDGEFDWKIKALKEIMAEVGGAFLPLNMQPKAWQLQLLKGVTRFVDDPLKLFRAAPKLGEAVRAAPINPDQERATWSRLFFLLVRHAVNTQATFRPSQGMSTTLGSFDTWDLGLEQSNWIAEKKMEAIAAGTILDDGGDLGCGGTFENGHMGYLEGIVLYNTKDAESVRHTGELIEQGADAAVEKRLGVPIAGFGVPMNRKFGPHCGHYDQWLEKIKQALDPNTASDPFFYAEPGNPSP